MHKPDPPHFTVYLGKEKHDLIMSLFNLYNEIKQEYENLIPDKREGLVLFALYQKQKDGDIGNEFSEYEIIKTLKETRNEIKTDQKVQFNNAIKYFQKYFLWRDERNRLYSLKPFTKKWCELIETALEESFNPTELQQEFLFITQSYEEQTFTAWYKVAFKNYSQRVESRINALYLQTERSVSQFMIQLTQENSYDPQALKKILETLESIRTKTEELNNAFQGAHDIQNRLIQSETLSNDAISHQQRKEVIYFFGQVRKNLTIISDRIDRIGPKLNEYIRDTDRRDFYRRYKLFLNHLLEESKVENNKIVLPEEIKPPPIGMDLSSRFIIVRENFDGTAISRYKKAKIQIPPVNEELANQRLLAEQEQILIGQKVKQYIHELDQQLKHKREVDFSHFFFEVLKKRERRYAGMHPAILSGHG